MIEVKDALYSVTSRIPEFIHKEQSGSAELRALIATEVTGEATLTIEAQRAGKVTRATLGIEGQLFSIGFGQKYVPGNASAELHAPSAQVRGATLDLGTSAVWKRHPVESEVTSPARREVVNRSWVNYPNLQEELRDVGGVILRRGVRIAQAGALHALAAHWSVKSSHALIVLPTGTGKTEVMMAASMLMSAARTLVVVPSDALRSQISRKFTTLGVLSEIGAVGPDCLLPVVGTLIKSPRHEADFALLLRANVVVTTTQMLLATDDSTLQAFLKIFDLVTFDEAHHLPAPSWERIRRQLDQSARVLSLTATPFRNDGKRLPGELIYQFPLRMAQSQGYFTKIEVVKIDQSNPELADVDIARAAVSALRKDDRDGFRHVILARSRSKDHANSVLAVYEKIASDLSPVLLYSGISEKRKAEAIEKIKSLESRVVVCVDMLGEGFDFSALKIAAMHELHKSLPVTLQFVGRFTRSSSAVGSATVVVNMSEPMANTAVAELFAEDADWNEIVPQLSAGAIDAGIELQELADRMKQIVAPDERIFDISMLSPGLSVLLYRVEKFEPGSVAKGMRRDSVLHQSWADQERKLLVAISRDLVTPDWSSAKDASSFEWNLFIASYDSASRVLMVNSTLGKSRIQALVHSICGKSASPVSGEQMFRVFDGMKRAVLHNVGLYRRGQVRFQMLMGIDVGEHVSQAAQTGSSKSNLFAVGYSEGLKESVGASFKGKIWSPSSATLPQWISWANNIAKKVLDNTIATNAFLSFTLIPTELKVPPVVRAFSCIPPEELLPGSYHGDKHLRYSGYSSTVTQSLIEFKVMASGGGPVEFTLCTDGYQDVRFEMTWVNGFNVARVSGPDVFVLDDGQEVKLQEYLTENPPALILADGSEVVGNYHYRYLSSPVYSYSVSSFLTPQWGSTKLNVESKWKGGVARPNSIQGFIISMLMAQTNDFVLDDDDSGEIADVIGIEDDKVGKELRVSLYHCKYAHGDSAGARVADLYEVCGQAIKSCRIMNRAEDLIAHILRRESRLGGRPTRFEKGSEQEMRSLKARSSTYRMKLQVYVVQPGLSARAFTPELSSILGAADNFVLEFTGRRLGVIASE